VTRDGATTLAGRSVEISIDGITNSDYGDMAATRGLAFHRVFKSITGFTDTEHSDPACDYNGDGFVIGQ